MKHNFFIRSLLIFLLPLLIPILILGTLSIVITQKHIKQQISDNNINMLNQTMTNVDLIFNEIDTLNIQIDSPSKTALSLKGVLQRDTVNASSLETIDMISFYMNSFANTKPYIHSIYVYYENDKGRFFSTNNSLSYLDSYYDSEWYKSYCKHALKENLWIEKRAVQQYSFQNNCTNLITVYKKMVQNNGVIVLNIKADYVQELLDNSLTSSDQKICIFDKNNKCILSSDNNFNLNTLNLNDVINENINRVYSRSENKYLNKELVHSDKFMWNYVSIIPESTLYYVSTRLIRYTITLLIVSFLLGIALTFYLTRKKYAQINNIISIIDCAKNNLPLPAIKNYSTNEFSYILENLVTTFIEQNYLKLQLSERKYKMENMELLALQSQINPHFLFNTLHTIYWEVVKSEGFKSKPVKMIENLSSILEYSLASPSRYVKMEDEIKYAKIYLDIQLTRYGDKFDVSWEYNDSVNNVSTIKLLLQPMIENAISHGINEKEENNIKGKIKIKIWIKENMLNLSIIDNGAGIKLDKLIDIRQKLKSSEDCNDHIGLFNTNKRLKLSYSDDCILKILSREMLGTAIYIKFPIK